MPSTPKKSINAKPERKPFESRHNKPTDPFYWSQEWRRTRQAHLYNEPLCRECSKQNLITPATEVDHITPINQGGSRLSMDNLQSLCHKHHAIKSGREAHE